MNEPPKPPVESATLAAEFPSLAGPLYANHAGLSPWPASASRAVAEFAELNARDGPWAYASWLRQEAALRERLARMLNAPAADNIALLGNTTEGVCTVAAGLDWRPGDNVVTLAGEFASNRLAWEALSARGVELREAPAQGPGEPEDRLLHLIDGSTRVLAVSAVQWHTGLRLDLARLGAACRVQGILFFVDAIQEFGALPMDVQACQIDCLAAGSHKWQMGPQGMGVFYCCEEWLQRLAPSRLGWHMLEDPFRFERAGRGPAATGWRFEPGSPNHLGQVALHAALGVLEEYGLERVAARVLDNTRRLHAGLQDIPGVRLTSDTRPGRFAGIVCFTPLGTATRTVFGHLNRLRVVCAWRGDGIRLSPHFYQGRNEMDALLTAVEDALAESSQ